MFMYVYLCESGYRGQITRKGPMMGAGKALREKHHRVIQHKPEEYGSWHVTNRWFQWGWDTGRWERGENWPQAKKKLESLQRNQEQSTPVSEWCCQELVNTKSAGCAAPAWDLTQVTDDIRMWLSSLQNQFEFDH